jgi:2-polyprenyl-3-methyl-5-hydroxy-6-metoxy-1,4-benzoquinol methylase
MMDSDARNDRRIIDSWHSNAAPWTLAVRQRQIESRRLVTDQAIVEAVVSRAPGSVLDLGCGEGWLARALAERGLQVVGVDVVAQLIEQAHRAGGGDFRLASYQQIAAGALAVRADLVVCNFSLLGKGCVEALMRAMPDLLTPGGALIVQTLHPAFAGGDAVYQDGWREGSWLGFDAAFSNPAPWYFRTLAGWIELFTHNGLQLLEVREPLHPGSGRPASILFIAAPVVRGA